MKKNVRIFFAKVSSMLVQMRIIKPKMIVCMDGGICSQINFYIYGQYFIDRFDVYYDLTWYEQNGKDLTGKFSREFELQQMFPNISLPQLPKWKLMFYRLFMKYTEKGEQGDIHDIRLSLKNVRHSIYLAGYLLMPPIAISDYTKDHFIGQLPLLEVPNEHAEVICGVHVRRGDLADVNYNFYGNIDSDYFFRAIDYVRHKYQNVLFCFFSDEPEWVETHITPNLKEIHYIFAPKNSKAYEDLCRLAHCAVIIASQGSFGKYAAMLNPHAELILCDNQFADIWKSTFNKMALV